MHRLNLFDLHTHTQNKKSINIPSCFMCIGLDFDYYFFCSLFELLTWPLRKNSYRNIYFERIFVEIQIMHLWYSG